LICKICKLPIKYGEGGIFRKAKPFPDLFDWDNKDYVSPKKGFDYDEIQLHIKCYEENQQLIHEGKII